MLEAKPFLVDFGKLRKEGIKKSSALIGEINILTGIIKKYSEEEIFNETIEICKFKSDKEGSWFAGMASIFFFGTVLGGFLGTVGAGDIFSAFAGLTAFMGMYTATRAFESKTINEIKEESRPLIEHFTTDFQVLNSNL